MVDASNFYRFLITQVRLIINEESGQKEEYLSASQSLQNQLTI